LTLYLLQSELCQHLYVATVYWRIGGIRIINKNLIHILLCILYEIKIIRYTLRENLRNGNLDFKVESLSQTHIYIRHYETSH
jgi:hypothetical protein